MGSKRRENLCDLELGKDFLNMTAKNHNPYNELVNGTSPKRVTSPSVLLSAQTSLGVGHALPCLTQYAQPEHAKNPPAKKETLNGQNIRTPKVQG